MASKVSRADWAATVPWAGVLNKPDNLGGVSDISQLAAAGYGAGMVPSWNGTAFVPVTLPSSSVTPAPQQPFIALTMPSIFRVAYSPYAGPETINVTLGTQAANLAFMGPATGAATIPAFRAFVGADFPALVLPLGSINATGTPSISTYLRGDGSWASSPVPALTSAHIFVGNGSNVATDVAMSGDATIDNTGAITVAKAAKWTTARNLAGNSVDGSAAVTFANKFIVQGTADAGLSGPQFLGALATGILKNTITTGVLSIAAAGDFPALPYAPSALTSAYLFVGNVSNVATGVAMTGDISITNAGLTAIGANKVTLAMMATQANNTVLGNISGGAAVPSALTASQTKTLLAIAQADVSGLTTTDSPTFNNVTASSSSYGRFYAISSGTSADGSFVTQNDQGVQFYFASFGSTRPGSVFGVALAGLTGFVTGATGATKTTGLAFGTLSSAPVIIGTNNITALTLDTSQNATFAGSITTGAPSGGTAGAWKTGIKVTAASVFDTTRYIQLDVGGVLYKLAVCV